LFHKVETLPIGDGSLDNVVLPGGIEEVEKQLKNGVSTNSNANSPVAPQGGSGGSSRSLVERVLQSRTNSNSAPR